MFQPVARKLAIGGVAALLTAGSIGGVAVAAHQSRGVDIAGLTNVATSTTASAATSDTRSGRHVGHHPAAKQAALTTVLDQLVTQGTISKDQEQSIEQALQQYRRLHAVNGLNADIRKGMARSEQQAILGSLHLTARQLRAGRRSGESIGQIARSQGVPLPTVESAILAAAKGNLDMLAANNGLSATTEQAVLTRLQTALPRRLTAVPTAHPGKKGGKGKATATVTSSATTSQP